MRRPRRPRLTQIHDRTCPRDDSVRDGIVVGLISVVDCVGVFGGEDLDVGFADRGSVGEDAGAAAAGDLGLGL